MIRPKISVIVATYNVEAYLVEAMDSLLGQSYPPFEILVINDGSTDGTLALLEVKYGDNPLVKIFTQENQGVGAVRKAGFDKASGDYLFFCDPDDVVSTDLFAGFCRALNEKPELELYYFSKRSFVDNAKGPQYLRRDTAPSREGWYARGTDLLEDLIISKKFKATTWQYIFKKAMTERFEVSFEGRAHEDQLFSMNVYLHSRLCYAIQADRYFQRVRPGSITDGLKDEHYVLTNYDSYRDTLEALKPHLPEFKRRREVALNYMTRGVKWTLKRSINNRVRLPDRVFALTRSDARQCGLESGGGLILAAPWLAFVAMKLRFELRVISRRLRGRGM